MRRLTRMVAPHAAHMGLWAGDIKRLFVTP